MGSGRAARETLWGGNSPASPKAPGPAAPSAAVYWLALALVMLSAPVCLSLTWIGARQVELFHAGFFNGCAIRNYAVHWQDPRRYPDPLRYDFTNSLDSVAVVVIWIRNGPEIKVAQRVPLTCPALTAPPKPRTGGQPVQSWRPGR